MVTRCSWLATLLLVGTRLALGQTSPPPSPPTPPVRSEYVEVTATRVPEETRDVPASITVLTARDLREIGATDLTTALRFAAGIDMAPGGDSGPAAAVPEIWGLREFDSVLLVVDGVPRSGAYVPDFQSIDLADVERIEVLRGAAPVTVGATSFNGAVHVVHRDAAASRGVAEAFGGSHGRGGGRLQVSLPAWGRLRSSLALEAERRGYCDPRTTFGRGHLLWQGRANAGKGTLRLDVDGVWLDQDPASPRPRVGGELSPRIPVDSNVNPEGSHLDERRLQLGGGYDRSALGGLWSSRVAFAGSRDHDLRGFLRVVEPVVDKATGYRRSLDRGELYLDSHVAWRGPVEIVAGVDWIHGRGAAHGGAFEYTVGLDGASAPDAATLSPDQEVRIESRRDFVGTYSLAVVHPVPSLRLQGGLRLNVTTEARDGGEGDEAREAESDRERTDVRPGGSVGAVFNAWSRGRDTLRVYADYRNTFKPAVFDFGVGEVEGEGLLEPETAQSVDGGVKARLLGGHLDAQASVFLMDFDNLVVSRSAGRVPGLENAGQARFKGAEVSLTWRSGHGLSMRGAWSWHDARFRHYETEFDGVPVQLAGRHLEMSPDQIASLGVLWAPERGPLASVSLRYVGERYLNKRNTALAAAYTTLDAAVGWRQGRYELRIDGRNLTDQRPPVAESELGDAQYYLLPSRHVRVSAYVRF